MKAFFATRYGGPEVMQLGELPDPRPRAREVVVAVKAASVNPVDWKVRDGAARPLSGWRFPKVLGVDFAGVVETPGAAVTGLAAGDRVYGTAAVMFGAPGAHAEKVAVPAKRLRRLPAGLRFDQAAALPVGALTAVNGLRKCGDLRGKSVAVNGATGGVGHFAVQLAKARGATVTAICSARNMERARSLGADRVIDYRSQDLTADSQRHDVLFDAFGKLPFAAAARVLAPNGTYVTTLGSPALFFRSLWTRASGGPHIAFANMLARPADHEALEADVLAGLVVPTIAHLFPLERAGEAFAALEAGGTVGKVVIEVAASEAARAT